MNETPRIPSPIPYLMQVPDLRAHNTTYDRRMLFMPVLMGLGSGRANVLAIAQWIEDQRDWLLALGFGRRKTATAPPARATIYRFIWALEQQAVALQLWARDVLQAPGQPQEGDCWRSAWMANTSRAARGVAWGIKPSYWSWLI